MPANTQRRLRKLEEEREARRQAEQDAQYAAMSDEELEAGVLAGLLMWEAEYGPVTPAADYLRIKSEDLAQHSDLEHWQVLKCALLTCGKHSLLVRGTELLCEVKAQLGALALPQEKDPPDALALWDSLKARLIAEGKYAPAQGGQA